MRGARIAYFSMEIGVSADIPTYSGGLGVLAGDTLRAAADADLPLVGVTLLHRKGYFRQRLDEAGNQTEEADAWDIAARLEEQKPRVCVELGGNVVAIRAWRFEICGVTGGRVAIYFLDTDLPENDATQSSLTDVLYGGDARNRLAQEAVLGIGGVRMLQALGYGSLDTYHMNEGHAGLLTLELMCQLAAKAGRGVPSPEDVAEVKNHCVFTTHTPVAAGHDRFPKKLVDEVLGSSFCGQLDALHPVDELNMTELALKHSRYVNGVARRHGDVTRGMFGDYDVEAITNGVHATTWASPSFRELFDRHVPGWREDNQSLRYVTYVPLSEIDEAHRSAKRLLLDEIRESQGKTLDEDCFTIGFARRATAYKRAGLLFDDVDRLNRMAEELGPLQIVYAGKAHPRDERGKNIIRRIYGVRERLSPRIELVYLENYGMRLGGLLTAGSDLWLNTPEPPKEASGTSGMKAALNGVPSLSILDGWWIEGHIEGVTGWSIREEPPALADTPNGNEDAASLYRKLEGAVLPMYYQERRSYLGVMRHAIALNGSFFNTERMVSEYAKQAYRLSSER